MTSRLKLVLAVIGTMGVCLVGQMRYISSNKTSPCNVTSCPNFMREPLPAAGRLPLSAHYGPITEDDTFRELETSAPNLASRFWRANDNKKLKWNDTCAPLPNIYNLHYNNLHWQVLHTKNGTFQLYAAYLDVRERNPQNATVRVLGMLDRIEPTVETHCQIWFDKDKRPLVVKSEEYRYIWNKKWGNYLQGLYSPYLISCPLPPGFEGRVPEAVSLVGGACETASNLLKVTYARADVRKDFAVCVKGLSAPQDISARLAEWIELLHILGARKVFLYELQVHPNVKRLLDYYQDKGMVHVTPLTLPGGQPNWGGLQHLYMKKKVGNKRLDELIPYNDCFYRNMYEYKFVVLLDTDEVIIPMVEHNWTSLLEGAEINARAKNPNGADSYNVRNVYFLDDMLHQHGWFDDVPHYLHMMQHVFKSKEFSKPGAYIKSFHNTETVMTLHNHFPFSCLGGPCKNHPIETKDAQMQHYRFDCVAELKKVCGEYKKNTVLDTTIWRYKEELVPKVMDALYKLGYSV